jgi:D-serine deaminase-like pyridoxal phosphate-dependent protein
MKMSGIEKSTLVVSKSKAESNIKTMAEKANRHNLIFRPHFKTHQSEIIGDLFKKQGIDKIAVSNIDMAYQFIRTGFNDIFLAITYNPLQAHHLRELSHMCHLTILVESAESLETYNHYASRQVNVMIKTDTGYRRTGINANDTDNIAKIIQKIESLPYLNFGGFVVHNGHTYHAESKESIRAIHHDSLKQLRNLKDLFAAHKPLISIGDTPSASICDNFEGVDEIRPGNFVYYDYMQYQLGACRFEDMAALVFAPVISLQPERNEIVLHCGAVHLSKEKLNDENGSHFGEVLFLTEDDEMHRFDPPVFVRRLSQEHGIAVATPEVIKRLHPGKLLAITPIHSCLTANLMKSDTVFIGD